MVVKPEIQTSPQQVQGLSPDKQTISKTTSFRLLKIDQLICHFADDNFKVDESGRMFAKSVENTGGKGEMLIMSNFSFSLSVFNRH